MDEDRLGWENAKQIDTIEPQINVDETVIDNNENLKYDLDSYEKIENNKKTIELISLIILALLLFIVGILIGEKLLKIDENDLSSHISKKTTQEKIEEELMSSKGVALVEEKKAYSNSNEEIEDITNEEEDTPIIYSKYKLQDSNDNNKECSISFGKAKNFSFSLGKNDAYIYGEYRIDGNIITCNAITWRNSEKQEAINSTIKLKIIEKDEVQIYDVNIYDGNEGLDKELINLDGLKVGMKYEL